MWYFVSRFFHPASCFQVLCKLWHASVPCSFLWLNNIPLHKCTTFCFSIHPLVNTWVASTLWPLWIICHQHWYTSIWVSSTGCQCIKNNKKTAFPKAVLSWHTEEMRLYILIRHCGEQSGWQCFVSLTIKLLQRLIRTQWTHISSCFLLNSILSVFSPNCPTEPLSTISYNHLVDPFNSCFSVPYFAWPLHRHWTMLALPSLPCSLSSSSLSLFSSQSSLCPTGWGNFFLWEVKAMMRCDSYGAVKQPWVRRICRHESSSRDTCVEGGDNSGAGGGGPAPTPPSHAVRVSRTQLFCFWEHDLTHDVPK